MAIFKCNKCGNIRELGNEYVGKSAKCPKCSEIFPIHNTLAYINALTKKYIIQKEKLKELELEREENSNVENIGIDKTDENHRIYDIDIYNTSLLAEAINYDPIEAWFLKKQIEIEINREANDTTGFFDEIALQMGNNYNTLKYVSDQIKYVQNKGYDNVKLDLSKKSNDEIKQIKVFCKEMYDYSFISRNYYQHKEKTIRLTLQKAPRIKSFFNGKWMEWFILMKLLEFFRDKKMDASCIRSLKVNYQDNSSNELDIFFLTADNTPVCIECKSGEFRSDIDKYLKLKKRLQLDKKQFILCIFGLSSEQTQGMSSMYDLTFTNEINLIEHIEKII